MIEAIIFDCFDVLVTNGLPLYYSKYLKNNPDKISLIEKHVDALNKGVISYDSFIEKASKIGNLPIEITRQVLDENAPNDQLFEYITKDLKSKYKIGMLSNAGDDWLDEMIGQERRSLFEVIVLSYEVGLIKPDPKIYRLTANKLNVDPSKCIMVDDKTIYCQGAEKAGMISIKYESFEQFKKSLDSLIELGI